METLSKKQEQIKTTVRPIFPQRDPKVATVVMLYRDELQRREEEKQNKSSVFNGHRHEIVQRAINTNPVVQRRARLASRWPNRDFVSSQALGIPIQRQPALSATISGYKSYLQAKSQRKEPTQAYPTLQTKLQISQPHDPAEIEADSVSEQIMRMPDISVYGNKSRNLVRRQSANVSAKQPINNLHLSKSHTGRSTPAVNNKLASQIQGLNGKGRPLPDKTRTDFEGKFGHSFENVRIHTNSESAGMAQSINARAFTTGNNIVFGEGQYNTESNDGKKLLAHELTHTIQQGAAGPSTGQVTNKKPISRKAAPAEDNQELQGLSADQMERTLLQENAIQAKLKSQPDAIQRMAVTNGLQQQAIRVNQTNSNGGRVFRFIGSLIERARNAVKSKIRDLPGYNLLTVVIGRDLTTGRVVPRTAANLIKGLVGEARYNRLRRSRMVTSGLQWFRQQIALLNLSPATIRSIFSNAVNYFKNNIISSLRNPLAVLRRFFGPPIARIRRFIGNAINKVRQLIAIGLRRLKIALLRRVLTAAGPEGQRIYTMFTRSRQTLNRIIDAPGRFFKNFLRAIKLGFERFKSKFVTHIKTAIFGWMFGMMSNIEITLPQQFDLKGIFSLAMQILGFTYQRIRQMIVAALRVRFGERAEAIMTRLESAVQIIKDIKEKGISALWDRVKDAVGNIKEMVKNAVITWLRNTIVVRAVEMILSMLNPVGALYQVARAIYNVVTFFLEKRQQIMALVNSILGSIGRVAAGNLGGAAAFIERAMVRGLSLLISFLARLLRLDGITRRIQDVIRRLRAPIDRAIRRFLTWVTDKAARLWGRIRGAFGRARDRVRNTVGRIVEWWKARKRFKAKDGNTHSLYFSSRGNRSTLMIASDAKPFENFIRTVETKDAQSRRSKAEALKIAKRIDDRKRDPVRGASEVQTERNKQKKKKDIDKLLNELSRYAKDLFGVEDQNLPNSKIDFSTTSSPGGLTGTKMTAEILTKKGPAGSTPTQTAHELYDKLNLRKDGGRSYYVKGHLLNHHIHGPGTYNNLTPLSQTGNRYHLVGSERVVKAATQSGAVVKYIVDVQYGRSPLDTSDSELESKGIDHSKWADIKKIRSVEKYVPRALTLSAWILEKDNSDKWTKQKQVIVSNRSILNPVDTNLSNYQVGEGTRQKERVSLTLDHVDKISKNTGISNTDLKAIQDVAINIPILNRYSQIVDAIRSSRRINENRKDILIRIVNELNTSKHRNVVLN